MFRILLASVEKWTSDSLPRASTSSTCAASVVLPVRVAPLGHRQVLGTDTHHDLAALAGHEAGTTMSEVDGKGEPLRAEREHESIRGPRDRALVQVHRRRADERGDEQVRGPLVKLLRRRQLLERAVAEEGDPVAHRHRLRLVVGDVEGRDSETPLDAKDLAPHLHAQVRVEVRERLVHEEHGGLADERPTHCDALALAAGELAGLAQDDLREPEHVGRLACLPLALVL